MDRNERVGDAQTAMEYAIRAAQAEMYTALPGFIEYFDAAKQTCTVRPAIKAKVRRQDESEIWVELPILLDCPVFFPSGGGYTLTFPIVKGDECLVVFSSRCIDNWWAVGGEPQEQAEIRMHDLSDGFVFVGVRSKPRFLEDVSTNSTQLRNDDGATYVEVKNNIVNVYADTANVNCTTHATVKAPQITLKNTGAALKRLMTDAVINFFNNHVHSNGNGGANTGAPTALMTPTNHATTIVEAE